MIIWFDSNMEMHVDKNASARNDFALAKYGSALNDVVFLGNVNVSGNKATFDYFHVKADAAKVIHDFWCCQSTLRKRFLESQLGKIEKAIAQHLHKNNYKRSSFIITFEVSNSSLRLFLDLGYGREDYDISRHQWDGTLYYHQVCKTVSC